MAEVNRLIRLHGALIGARCAMSAPRMDSDVQARNALRGILTAFDRQTERELRAVFDGNGKAAE